MNAELLSLVTSANIACGFHAGGPLVMRATVAQAARSGVVIGARPARAKIAADGCGTRAPALRHRTHGGQNLVLQAWAFGDIFAVK